MTVRGIHEYYIEKQRAGMEGISSGIPEEHRVYGGGLGRLKNEE